jgi:hypothetical protein
VFDFLKKAVQARNVDKLPPPAPVSAHPLGLRVGGAVSIDPLPFRVLADQLLFVLPEGNQMIEARGRVDLGQGAALDRFYLTDDVFVQVHTQAGIVEELKLFQYAETRHPNTRAALEAWLNENSELGRAEVTLKGRHFTRVWGDDAAPYSPPVVFDEHIYKQSDATPDYDLTHYAMLYQRALAHTERTEYLLISVEDSGPNDFCVVFSVGVDVSPADLEIV